MVKMHQEVGVQEVLLAAVIPGSSMWAVHASTALLHLWGDKKVVTGIKTQLGKGIWKLLQGNSLLVKGRAKGEI